MAMESPVASRTEPPCVNITIEVWFPKLEKKKLIKDERLMRYATKSRLCLEKKWPLRKAAKSRGEEMLWFAWPPIGPNELASPATNCYDVGTIPRETMALYAESDLTLFCLFRMTVWYVKDVSDDLDV